MEYAIVTGLVSVVGFSLLTFTILPRLWQLADEKAEAEKEELRRNSKTAHDEAVDGASAFKSRKSNDSAQPTPPQKPPTTPGESAPEPYREDPTYQPAVEVPPDFVLADYSGNRERD